jgi:hypothetical protein
VANHPQIGVDSGPLRGTSCRKIYDLARKDGGLLSPRGIFLMRLVTMGEWEALKWPRKHFFNLIISLCSCNVFPRALVNQSCLWGHWELRSCYRGSVLLGQVAYGPDLAHHIQLSDLAHVTSPSILPQFPLCQWAQWCLPGQHCELVWGLKAEGDCFFSFTDV